MHTTTLLVVSEINLQMGLEFLEVQLLHVLQVQGLQGVLLLQPVPENQGVLVIQDSL